MAVIGNRAATNYQTIRKQTITGTGATSYSLDYSVSSPNDLEVFVNNVRQEPTTAYTASGQTITFTEAVNSTDSVYIIYQGQTVGSVVHPSDQPLEATTGTFTGTIAQSKAITTQWDGIGVRMGSSTANTNRGATFLQHTYVDGGGNQGNYVYNHSLRQNDGTYIANVYTADYSAGVHSWYHPNGGLSGNPVMQIDPAGRVTRPYQPAFFTINLTFPNTGGAGYGTGGSALVNTGSHYATGTGRFTAPIAGTYVFYMMTQSYGSGNTSGQYQTAIFRRNGSDIGAQTYHGWAPNDGNNHVQAQNTLIITLDANDYMQAYVVYGGREIQNYFGGYLLG